MAEEAVESASVTVRGMETGSQELVVENYSQCCKGIGVGKRIESAEFIVGGHRWAIRFFPEGKTLDAFNNKFASLYVFLKSETTSVVRCLYELYILDQSGKGNHLGSSMFKFRPPEGVPSLKQHIISGWTQFVEWAVLESPDYLKDDCLRIHATVGVLSFRTREMPLIRVPESDIGADLGKMLESKQGADVFFKVAGERLCAHKFILAANSPVFRSRFSNAHQHHQEIVITDVEPRIFKAMLWFMYTGRILAEEQEAIDSFGPFILESFMVKMLAVADRFELKRLKKICESHILEIVSEESVAYLLHLADLYHATELKDACLRFLAENFAAVMESDGREYLKETYPLLFLDLAGYKENLSTGRQEELDLSSDIFSTVKDSFVGIFWPWHATNMKHKIKDL